MSSSLEDAWLEVKNVLDSMFNSPGAIEGQQVERLRSVVRELLESDEGLQDCRAEEPPPAKRARVLVAAELDTKMKDYLGVRSAEMKQLANDKAGNELLEFFYTNWTCYSTVVDLVFCHRNGCILENGPLIPGDIKRLAVDTWRRHGIRPTNLQFISALLSQIARQRQGEKVDSIFLVNILTYARSIDSDFYSKFGQLFCQDSARFYREEHDNNHQRYSSYAECLAAVEQWLKREEAICNRYLTQGFFVNKCLQKCMACLLSDIDFMRAFPALLKADNVDDLARMYYLCSTCTRLLLPASIYYLFVEEFKIFVTDRGLEAIKSVSSVVLSTDGQDAKLYVDVILGLHRKYYNLVLQAFSNDRCFVEALNEACKTFVNKLDTQLAKRNQKLSELLARYSDALFKKPSQDNGIGSDEQDGILTVLNFISDKYLFQKYYSCLLGRRLLFDLSTSLDTEAAMLLKLQKRHGFEYTYNMERMLHSIATSRELNSSFKDFLLKTKEAPLELDFKIKALPVQAWSVYISCDSAVTIPFEMERCCTLFGRFYRYSVLGTGTRYNRAHGGHKLRYYYNLSLGELVTNFTSQRYALQATTYQIAVLMMFNTETCYTVQEIAGTTSIEPQVLQQVLAILVKAKLLLPTAEPEAGCSSADSGSSELSPGSRLTLNQDFKNKRLRINLNSKRWVERAAV